MCLLCLFVAEKFLWRSGSIPATATNLMTPNCCGPVVPVVLAFPRRQMPRVSKFITHPGEAIAVVLICRLQS